MGLKPHDLLLIREGERCLQDAPFPDWVGEALRQSPWVVVRRAVPMADRIPVGIRGKERGLRFSTWISPDQLMEKRTPAMLTDPAAWRMHYPAPEPPQLISLLNISPLLNGLGYEWGPAGSFGYELACGRRTASADSDLDLVVETPSPVSLPAARSLLAAMETLSLVRLDVQMSTPSGGVSWAEYCAEGPVLVKTDAGPAWRKKNELWP